MDAVAYYSDVADEFHASYGRDANRQERVQVWRGYFDRFLHDAAFAYDLGCGSGILACELARRGIETIGIDGAGGMLKIAETTARARGIDNVGFRQHRLPIADTTGFRIADAIISSSALEYLDSMPEALEFLGRLLRPGGITIFSVSNADSLSRKAVRLVHRLTGRPAYFSLLKQFRTPEALRRELQQAGFEYLDHSYFAKADRINRLLGRVLPDRYASNMVIVAAQRR